MEQIKLLFKSRKFQIVLTSVAGIISSAFAGAITPQVAMYGIVALVIALISTIAWEDSSKRGDVFEKAKALTNKADWLITTSRDLLNTVEERAQAIEKD